MGPVTEYITNRLKELDALLANEPADSKHNYPLLVAKYELCKLATELKIALKRI
jgi:hypothetical protein